MKILSVDPGRSSAGIAVIEPKRLEAFRFRTKKVKHEALGDFLLWMIEVVDRERPNLAFVEDYLYGIKRTSTLTQVAEVGGIARGVFASRGVPVIAVPVQTWKSLTIGNLPKGTKAKNDAYCASVESRYGMRFGSTDEADAFLIYQAMRSIWKNRGISGNTNRRLREELAAVLEKYGEGRESGNGEGIRSVPAPVAGGIREDEEADE